MGDQAKRNWADLTEEEFGDPDFDGMFLGPLPTGPVSIVPTDTSCQTSGLAVHDPRSSVPGGCAAMSERERVAISRQNPSSFALQPLSNTVSAPDAEPGSATTASRDVWCTKSKSLNSIYILAQMRLHPLKLHQEVLVHRQHWPALSSSLRYGKLTTSYVGS